MREIKFRAWDITNKEMFQVHSLGSKWSSEDGLMFGDGRFPSMQYTGLKDKNGKEIYEGDIVHIDSSPQEDNKIEYYDGIYMLLPHGLYLSDWYKFVEVIGNIYENPELIKEEVIL